MKIRRLKIPVDTRAKVRGRDVAKPVFAERILIQLVVSIAASLIVKILTEKQNKATPA